MKSKTKHKLKLWSIGKKLKIHYLKSPQMMLTLLEKDVPRGLIYVLKIYEIQIRPFG